ncbi:Protein translocase subunit SecE [Candidatus Hartigia pinicola]|nr:Protein translocase subunit SecE [Candidatus Hartigia pinicola]
MNTNTDTQVSRRERNIDVLKWIVIVIFLLISIVGNYYFRQYNPTLRTFSVVTLLTIASFIAACTKKGKKTLVFLHEARIEIRKVIWPTRQEALQTTFIVAVVTTVMSLILWGLDGILVRLVSFIINLRLF